MSFVSRKTLKTKILKSRPFRQAFVWEHLKRSLPFQVRTMREEREWSQQKAGEELGKPQSVISRLESPAYGKLTLQTLVDIANGFDVGLLIKFVPFSRLVREYEDVSHTALSARSVSDPTETSRLEYWARQPDTALPGEIAPINITTKGTGKLIQFARRFNTASNMEIRVFEGDPTQAKFSFMYESLITIDKLVITHPDKDHLKGIEDLKFCLAKHGVGTVEFVSTNVEEAQEAA